MDERVIYRLTLTLIPTILIEYGVLLLLGEKRRKVLFSSVMVNILTNIPLNLYLMYVSSSMAEFLCGELLVVLVETFWYYGFLRDWRRAAVYSLLCNVVSMLTGVLFQLLYSLICQ